jgi:chemotaxis protein histidine kinase CheA
MKSDQLPEGIPEEELIRIYVTAARANLSTMTEALERLSSENSFPDLATLHRLSHNLKGSSRQFGFQEPAGVACGMEAFAAQVLQGDGSVTEEDRGLLREAIACLAEMVGQIEEDRPNADPSALCRRLQKRDR